MSAWIAAAIATGVVMLLGWVLSLVKRDASVADPIWGPCFGVVAWVGFALGPHGVAALALASMVSAWGLRLGVYLALRNRGKPEDHRYAKMRADMGLRFRWVSLFTVFGLQGALLWVVSMPVQAAMGIQSEPLGLVHAAGAALFSIGLGFEAIGDHQLARFKQDSHNHGKVMDQGLWSLTRHPNYFGDFCVWWGLGVFACASGAPLYTLVGPVVMSVLLMRVSGVTLLERTMRKRPGYDEYVRRTSAFFPMPSKR